LLSWVNPKIISLDFVVCDIMNVCFNWSKQQSTCSCASKQRKSDSFLTVALAYQGREGEGRGGKGREGEGRGGKGREGEGRGGEGRGGGKQWEELMYV